MTPPEGHGAPDETMLCPDCKLTPAGSYLMRRALDGMQRTRADDPSWRPLICGRCGEVSGIIDDDQGWVFGREPQAAGASSDR